VRREGPNQLVVEEFDHWGDSFDAQVSQVLVQNLEALVPGTRAMAFPWRVPGQPDLQLVVDVPRFDADAAGAVSLDARWELVDPAGRKRVAFGNSRIRKQAEGPEAAAVVAAMSDALGDFSREVARVIQESGR